MSTYSDTYLNHLGDIFIAHCLQAYGVVFEDFLKAPELYLENAPFNLIAELELLQADLDALFEQQGHVVEMHGDRMIEPFHHNAVPKKWKTNIREDGYEQHHQTLA